MGSQSVNAGVFFRNYLGASARWYKALITFFLILNPILLYLLGPFITGWALLAQFIFTLAMALKCYPLQPGGLLAIEAIALGMAPPEAIYREIELNIPVILLLVFMVAGIYFMQEFLLYIFENLILKVKSKIVLSLLFSFLAAFLSAFLDALTVTAALIAVAVGFYSVYHNVTALLAERERSDESKEIDRVELEEFRAFLRNLMMHGVVGTALGGAMTIVGEPQNLLIGHIMEWDFIEFVLRMWPVTGPVFIVGLLTCFALERFSISGYGRKMPERVRSILEESALERREKRAGAYKARLITQGIVALYLVVALALHIAEIGIIGLSVIILLTAFNGITHEKEIGKAFEEALPFTALIVVFFAIVAVIHEQHLFAPIIDWTLDRSGSAQIVAFYIASGLLSALSDNVFVATIYISEAKAAFSAGAIDRAQFDLIAVAINTGTNLVSVATPNGQAAFLFLLTSSLAMRIQLSYVRMLYLALPYTFALSAFGLIGNYFFLR